MRVNSHHLAAGTLLSLLCIFLAERVLAGSARTALNVAVGVLLALGAGGRLFRLRHSSAGRRPVERLLLLLQGLIVVGLGAYLVTLPRFTDSAVVRSVFGALFPIFIFAGGLALFFAELAYAGMSRAEVIEGRRVTSGAFSGLGFAAALTFAFAAYYVAAERDAKWDLSYFRTTRPSDSTRQLVTALTEPVQVFLFYPPGSDVQRELAEYFDELSTHSDKLEVSKLDQAVNPKQAKELGVTGNGTAVVVRGSRKEQLSVPAELERARTQLRTLDVEFQKRLLLVAREKRVLYFTRGHGERSERAAKEGEGKDAVRLLRELLSYQNYELRDLSAANGLATEVPSDAALVIAAGPETAFLAEESAALKVYFEKGGRLLLLLEPGDDAVDHAALLAPLGLRFDPTVLANERMYLARRYEDIDRRNLATTSFSSHPAVTSISQLGQTPLLLSSAGSLSELPSHGTDLFIDFLVRAEGETFGDENGNLRFDEAGEKKATYPLAAAVTRRPAGGGKEGRAIVMGDVDALGDLFIKSRGNAYFAIDGAKWAIGEDAVRGAASSEVDAPIQHTKGQDAAWFYATVFLVPLSVLVAGFLFTRKRRRGARPVAAAGGAA